MLDLKKLLRVKDTMESRARGMAVGFFWGVSLFWGGQIVAAVVTAQLVRGNKVIAAAMTAISNPLTTIPLYSFCYFLGHLIVPGPDLTDSIKMLHSIAEILDMGGDFILTMLIGTTLVGVIGAVLVYLVMKRIKYGALDPTTKTQ